MARFASPGKPRARPQDLRRGREVLLGPLALACACAAHAQPAPPAAPEAQGPRTFAISSGLTLEGSVVDIADRPLGSGSEAVVRAIPSVTMAHRQGRLQGALIYSGELVSRRGIDDRQDTVFLNSLSANYLLEAIEGIGFIDARASITQQNLSLVGTPVQAVETTDNRNEVRALSLSPHLRGRLGSFAEYELRAVGTATRGTREATGNTDVLQGSFALGSPRSRAVFGWRVSGVRQRVEFHAAAAPTVTDRASAEVALQPDIDWRFTVSGGVERTDVVGAFRQEYENYGVGAQWTPSPRTTVAVQGEERYFGRGHRLSVSHRFSRSTLRLTSARDLNIAHDGLILGRPVTLYELYYAQLADAVPDPVQRDQLVLGLIAATGRDRNEIVNGGLIASSGVTIERRRELLWTWAGSRLTISISAFGLDSERADRGGVNPTGPNDNVRQRGYSGGAGWRLTPSTNINAAGARTMSRERVLQQRVDLKALSFGLTSQLGRRTTGSLSARYSVLNGATETFRETALTGSISLRF
ncbi:MAG: TIGR03016 family PEP-CTERM system-associated outer membrane protein [Rubrivivax sp.]|nr:TIGR03016 family PEP-CTERM system-associated outer membrane protein [Rubrivivax sp.]